MTNNGTIQCDGSCSASTPSDSLCAKPDLTVDSASADERNYDKVTGEYENVDFEFNINNEGGTTTAYEGVNDVDWELTYEDKERSAPKQTTDDSTSPISANDDRFVEANVSNVMFGVYSLENRVDQNNKISETNDDNNSNSSTVILEPQDPDMDLSVSSQIVRSGDTATIEWDTNATYPMDCTLNGPGIDGDTSTPGNQPIDFTSPDSKEDSTDTTPRYNTSIYTLTCDVIYPGDYPKIDKTFSASTQVEVIPRLEEI
jgi:hypothetical protein